MNRVASCPTCKTDYELDEDDIGHLMECECGAALFACHTRSLAAFWMQCKHCGGKHQVCGGDAGRTVRVDCGASVCIPAVTLRTPIGTRDTAAKFQASAVSDELPFATPPGDMTAQEVRGRVAILPPPVTSSTAVQDSENDTSSTQSATNREQAKPKTMLGPRLGFLGVVGLLVVAIVMFFLREPPSLKRRKRSIGTAQVQGQDSFKPSAELAAGGIDGLVGADGLKTAIAWQETKTLPASNVTSLNDRQRNGTTEADGGYRVPPPPIYALPPKREPRVRVPVIREKVSVTSLARGIELAFAEYEKVEQLRDKSTASETKQDIDEYQQALSRALGIIEHVHTMALVKNDIAEVATMRYLLAYLYLTAGLLPEACVMGEAVARWGDVSDPSTREAAMISLAAAQELSETHWGNPEDLGELRQMEVIAGILQKRWPKNSQSDLIWMNLGYLYEAFNQPRQAIRIYERVPEMSDHYTTACLASGLAQWNVLRQQALDATTSIDSGDRKLARQKLTKGLRETEKSDPEISQATVEARLALAQIDFSAGKPEQAETWLVEEPPAVITSIRVNEEDDKNPSGFLVDEATAKQMFDVLFHARNQRGDMAGATSTLEDMARLLDTSDEQVAARRISILKSTFERMKSGDDVTEQDFATAKQMSSAIMEDESTIPTSTLLWLGESWAQSGERAQDSEIAKGCARLGSELFGKAILRNDFPANSMQAAQLRRIELLRRSGSVMESLKQIEDMLAGEPNVFALQITAAQTLQELAVEDGRASDLLAAINGPSGFSPIWGWGKLVTTLHAAKYSAAGTPRHSEQLSLAQYHLYQCRYLLAVQAKDPMEKARQLAEVGRALAKLMATMDKQSVWFPRYEALQALIGGPK